MSNEPATTATPSVQGVCPECEGIVRFDRVPVRGQVSRCVACGVELEVTAVSPLSLVLAPEVEEDWGE